jgi:predicted nucleic acid-binding protein
MKVAIKDANVFIDLEIAGLFDLWFQLGIETHTSVFIREELERGCHVQALGYFESGQVVCHEFDFEEIVLVERLMQEVNRAAGFNDCSVLYLAEKLKAPLLSGDIALRRSAERRGVQVKGTLWVFDLLVARDLLEAAVAARKLRNLLQEDRRLPEDECQNRLERWEAGQGDG